MKRLPIAVLIATLLLGRSAPAQNKPGPKQLGIDEVTVSKPVETIVAKSGQKDSLDAFLVSLSEHLMVEFEQTNKFKVIARSDLARILNEQQIPTGVIRDPTEQKALPGMIKGLDVLVSTKVTEFKDETAGIILQGMGQRVDTHVVQATGIIKIYDATTGEFVKSVDIPVREEAKGVQVMAGNVVGNNAVDTGMIEAAATRLAKMAATRVAEVLYPAKVVGVTDGIVFINRGEGQGISPGEGWEIFSVGPAMVDPDTGKKLSAMEFKIAEIEITDVLADISKARIIGDNRGIDVGAICRRKFSPGPAGPPR